MSLPAAFEYKNFLVKVTRDFGLRDRGETGLVITDEQGACNVMPGGVWAKTEHDAKRLIDAFLKAGGTSKFMNMTVNGSLFWDILNNPSPVFAEGVVID